MDVDGGEIWSAAAAAEPHEMENEMSVWDDSAWRASDGDPEAPWAGAGAEVRPAPVGWYPNPERDAKPRFLYWDGGSWKNVPSVAAAGGVRLVQRWFASLVDYAVVAGVYIGADVALGNAVFRATLPLWIGWALLYFPLAEGLGGTTLGKLITGSVVVRGDGSRPGIGRAALRSVLRLIEVNPILMGGIPAGVAVLASKGNQRLGDMAADTYVLGRRDLRMFLEQAGSA